MSTITLPFDGRPKSYDRDRLATAILVYLDVAGTRSSSVADTSATAVLLRNEHGFATDAITYAIGARIARETGVEP